MEVVEVVDKQGTYNLYDMNDDVVGRVCIDTGRAMIGNAFYNKVDTCNDISDEYDYDEDMVFHCSECGCELWVCTRMHHDGDYEYMNDYDQPNMFVSGKAEYPKYCPNCGRAIVNIER